MVAFIFTFDLKVRSLKSLRDQKGQIFSIKILNRMQNLLRISMMCLVVVYDDNKCQKIIFDGLQMDVCELPLCFPCQTTSISKQHDTVMASFDLGVP